MTMRETKTSMSMRMIGQQLKANCLGTAKAAPFGSTENCLLPNVSGGVYNGSIKKGKNYEHLRILYEHWTL